MIFESASAKKPCGHSFRAARASLTRISYAALTVSPPLPRRRVPITGHRLAFKPHLLTAQAFLTA